MPYKKLWEKKFDQATLYMGKWDDNKTLWFTLEPDTGHPDWPFEGEDIEFPISVNDLKEIINEIT